MSSSSNKKSSAWAKGTYNGGSAFNGTQPRLFSLDKKALVTPRASSSASARKSTAKQPSLASAFRRQERAAASSPRTAVRPSQSKGKGKENAVPLLQPRALVIPSSGSEDDDDDNRPVAAGKSSKPGLFSRLFSTVTRSTSNADDTSPSSAVSARQQSQSRPPKGLGKRIVNPSVDQLRRGPTIDLDASQELPADGSEMLGESQRRKRKRVQEGSKGQLDLIPADDHEGFGGRSQQASGSSRKRVKRELVLERTSQQKMDVVEDSAEEDEEDSWEPEPSTAPEEITMDQPPSSQQPSRSYAESSEGDDDFLQRQLVPRRNNTSIVLVPDSDDLMPTSSGEGGWEGAGAADDSGFAEMDDEPEEVKDEKEAASILPSHLTSSYSRRPPKILSQPVEMDMCLDEDPVPSQLRSVSVGATRTVGRTPSGILMPPPPLPRNRSSPESLKTKDEQPLIGTKRVSSPATPPTDSPQSSPIILVFNTQPRDTSISPLRPSLVKQLGPALCEETQLRPFPPPRLSTTPPPVASTSRLAAVSPRRQIVSTWDSLASAWAGQRPPSPRKPASPRQSRLNEFFNVPSHSADDDETQVVEDSQPTCVSLTLEQAAAFHLALQTTREMGRFDSKGSLGVVHEEVEDIDEVQDVDMVATSDAEEESWSPLGSPTKFRYPTLSRGASQPRPSRSQSQGRQASQQAQAPTSSQQRGADQLAQLETQWESYWSEETYQPFVPLEE